MSPDAESPNVESSSTSEPVGASVPIDRTSDSELRRIAENSHLIDADRMTDVEHKQRLIAKLLETERLDAVLLQSPENFAWFTSGGESVASLTGSPNAAVFVTADARLVVCSNVDSQEMFEHQVPRLGFQLKERPWEQPRSALFEDLCRGRKVGSDLPLPGTIDIAEKIRSLRNPLTAIEAERLRRLGRQVAHAVEATGRNCYSGQTESQIAGQLAHRLVKHRITPERLQVWADDRGTRYRRWGHGDFPARKTVIISAVGRRGGLCVGATRIVSFGDPPRDFANAFRRAALVQATGMFFSQAQWKLYEVWNRIARIYEKFGHADEWRLSEQAEIIGYSPNETPLVPHSQFQLVPRMPLHWHASIGPVRLGDTILIGDGNHEIVTPTETWPRLTTEVKGVKVFCPDILRRERPVSRRMRTANATDASGDSLLLSGPSGDGSGSTEAGAAKPTASDEDSKLNFGADVDLASLSNTAMPPRDSDESFDLDLLDDSIFGDDSEGHGSDSIFD